MWRREPFFSPGKPQKDKVRMKTVRCILGRKIYHQKKNKTPDSTYLNWDSLHIKCICIIQHWIQWSTSKMNLPWGPFIKNVRKIFRKTNICNPLIRTRTCTYQDVRNVSFSENCAYVLNEWPHEKFKNSSCFKSHFIQP